LTLGNSEAVLQLLMCCFSNEISLHFVVEKTNVIQKVSNIGVYYFYQVSDCERVPVS